MTSKANGAVAVCLIVVGLGLVYWHVAGSLVDAWIGDGNYSHGFLIVPIAAYLAWERRARLKAAPVQGSWLGLVVLLGGVFVLLTGLLGSELFLSRISLIFVIAGILLFLYG